MANGERPLVVADGSVRSLQRRGRAVICFGTLTDAALEHLPGALAPRTVRGDVEVLLEVVRRSGLVTAKDDMDGCGRQVGAGVECFQRRIVPHGDGAIEDLRRG